MFPFAESETKTSVTEDSGIAVTGHWRSRWWRGNKERSNNEYHKG